MHIVRKSAPLTGRFLWKSTARPAPSPLYPPFPREGGTNKKTYFLFLSGRWGGSRKLRSSSAGKGGQTKSLFSLPARKVGQIEEASFFFPWERGTDQEAFRGRMSKFFAGMRKAKVSRKKEGRSKRVFAGEGIRDEVVSCPLRAHAPGREKHARKGDFLPPLILVLRGDAR